MSDRVISVSLHESGHASACIFFGFKFETVTNIPNYEKNTLGCLSGGPSYHVPDFEFCDRKVNGKVFRIKVPGSDRIPLTDEQIEQNTKNIMMTLAGGAAEEFFYGYATGCESDFDIADGIIWYNYNLKKSNAEVVKERFKLMEDTRKMFGHMGSVTPLWPKCYEIGKRLHRKGVLSYAECKAIYDSN